jgi:hypothetical protein
MSRLNTALVVVAGAAAATVASPDPAVLSYTYSDLNGSFDLSASQFTAVADASTSGDVTRLDGPTDEVAEFDADFVSGPDLSNAVFTIDVSNIGLFTADGVGTFELTDTNGDLITGDMTGSWFRDLGGNIFYQGTIANAGTTDVSGDMLFNGSTQGSFSTVFSSSPLDGAIVVLAFDPAPAFFTEDFDNIATLISARLVPTPGTAGLLAIGGLAAARRRR